MMCHDAGCSWRLPTPRNNVLPPFQGRNTYRQLKTQSCQQDKLKILFHLRLPDISSLCPGTSVDCVWNVMAHTHKPDFFFRRNGRVHLNRRGRQFSRLLAGELWATACRVCTARASLCSAVMWRLLVTHSILLFPILYPPVRHRMPSHFNWTLTIINPRQPSGVQFAYVRPFRQTKSTFLKSFPSHLL